MPFKLGSPPRMRGKDFLLLDRLLAKGITPAYAGKSSVAHFCTVTVWDHPRVCGEKSNPDYTDNNPEGSPPRMRGKADPDRTHAGVSHQLHGTVGHTGAGAEQQH